MGKFKEDSLALEKKRPQFFLLGFVVALSAALMVLEYRGTEEKTPICKGDFFEASLIPIEQIPIARIEKPVPPKPKVNLSDQFKISDEPVTQASDADQLVPNIPEPPVNLPIMGPIADLDTTTEEVIHTQVDKMPQFPGGVEKLYEFLGKNIKYPSMALDGGIQGVVYVTFVVEKDGSVSDPKVLRGIGGGCDEEALRVVRKLPKWEPGEQRGRKVKVQYNVPVRFRLK
ncbi:MAG: energy transducer TonB [Luteibaculum sp.]